MKNFRKKSLARQNSFNLYDYLNAEGFDCPCVSWGEATGISVAGEDNVKTGITKGVPFVVTPALAPMLGNAGPRRAVFLGQKGRIFLLCHRGEQSISPLTASVDNQQSKIDTASSYRTACGIRATARGPIRFQSSSYLLTARGILVVSCDKEWTPQGSRHFSIGIFYSNETEIFESRGGIVFIGSFSKPSGRELSHMMSLSNDYSLGRRTRGMFRRLENCVKRGTSIRVGDWELLYEYLMKVAAGKGAAVTWKAADKALWKFFAPGTAKWNPAKGSIELYFEGIVDQVCRLQTQLPPFLQSALRSEPGENTCHTNTR